MSKIPIPKPKIGDLVFCHCIGSKYGWFLNQQGIVIGEKTNHYVTKRKKDGSYASRSLGGHKRIADSFAKSYKILLIGLEKRIVVDYISFENGDIEIISDYDHEEVQELKEKTSQMKKMSDISNEINYILENSESKNG
jgi:hypothetical protein|tara:strand:- start:4779 stop:5192 length:414 start_codon:yes stop_codon:yes gene_type:complete